MSQLTIRQTNIQGSFTRSELDEDDISHLDDESPGVSNTATLLHAAAVNGNKRLLQKMLQEVVNSSDELNRGDQFGRTPLVYSVLGDRLDCAKLLIMYGASVSMSDFDGRTPLHWAAYQGSQKCVKLLITKGADWKAKDTKGRTPLHFAASHESSKCLSVLLKKTPKGEFQVDDPDNDSMTALHWGAFYGNTEHVKMLLKAKASVKLLDLECKTPLHWATTNRNTTVVKLILKQNDEIINWQDVEGRTALHLAVARQNEDVVKTLLTVIKCNPSLQDNMGRSPLHWAAVLENSHIVKMLVDKGADYTLVDGNGSTALHYAAQGNYAKTVEAILSGCNVKDTPDNKGKTPLMWAAGKGANAALQAMLNHQLDVHVTDNSGRTALHIAAYSGDFKCVKLLLSHGASVNALDELNHTPLFRACEMGYADVVNLLKQNKAILDLEDQDGRSPLHWAALNGHAHICLTLVTDGCQANRSDKLGCTPLHCAAYGGFVNCMSLLIDHGADVNKLDNEGISAFHWSCSSGHLEAVKLLFRKKAFPNFIKLNEERLTPLDYAILGDHQDVAQFMIEQGGLTFRAIQDVAATTIQSCWRGYRVRKPFQKRKTLYMRHEQLKRDMKRKSGAAKEEQPYLQTSTKPSNFEVDYHEGKVSPDSGRRRALCHRTSSVEDGLFQLDLELLQPERIVTDYCVMDDGDDCDDDSFSDPDNNFLYEQYEEDGMLPTILELSYPTESRNALNNSNNDMKLHESTIRGDKTESPSPVNTQMDQQLEEQKPDDIKASIFEILVKECPHSKSNMNTTLSPNIESNTSTKVVTHEIDASKLPDNTNKPVSYKDPAVKREEEIVLCPQTSEYARKERQRRQLIRIKMNAATTIQQWYRRHRKRKQDQGNISEIQHDHEDLINQIAALTIQLWWRKYLCREYHRTQPIDSMYGSRVRETKKNNQSQPSKVSKQRRNVSGRTVLDDSWRRSSKSKHILPSPTAMRRRGQLHSVSTTGRDGRVSTPRRGGNNRIRPSEGRQSKSGWSQNLDSTMGRKSKNSWKS